MYTVIPGYSLLSVFEPEDPVHYPSPDGAVTSAPGIGAVPGGADLSAWQDLADTLRHWHAATLTTSGQQAAAPLQAAIHRALREIMEVASAMTTPQALSNRLYAPAVRRYIAQVWTRHRRSASGNRQAARYHLGRVHIRPGGEFYGSARLPSGTYAFAGVHHQGIVRRFNFIDAPVPP